MTEEFDTYQLVEFCQRLGLAQDGYLDEKQLAVVCNCLGLQAPEDMLKELFDELDKDKDGRIGLDELSQMLRGMPTKQTPLSPEKKNKVSSSSSQSSRERMGGTSPYSSLHRASATSSSEFKVTNGDRSLFSILDPNNTGFTKIGVILDMWSHWGINIEDGLQILKDMGFPSSRSDPVNVTDLTRAMEEEADNVKDALPITVQTTLLTYRTETQYLRSICESMEAERDKLKSDVVEAHQRSTLLAQEVDEQNSRLERNSQMLLQKAEVKYTEQMQELQQKFVAEKENLQQALYVAESQLKNLQNEDLNLRSQLQKLNEENSNWEKEVNTLNKEIHDLQKAKNQLEKEVEKCGDLEHKLVEMERRHTEMVNFSESKLHETHGELQLLRDQNDELSSQLETMREKVKALKTLQERRSSNGPNKRRKGHSGSSGSKSLTLDYLGRVDLEDSSDDSPLEKIGKFHLHLGNDGCGDVTMLTDDVEELETSLASCSSSHQDSGNFPVSRAIINLGACVGETSTDSLQLSLKQMETVKMKVDVDKCLKSELEKSDFENMKKSVVTQTEEDNYRDMDMQLDTENSKDSEMSELRERIAQLENRLEASEQEKKELTEQCNDLKSSLEQMAQEFEELEDYWGNKLKEAREEHEKEKELLEQAKEAIELEKQTMDGNLQHVLEKIKEYEETLLLESTYPKLPPIEERASLEQQVTELEEECETMRKELRSLRMEKESAISNYHRQWEARSVEECTRLEQQVSVLTKKCQDYENRLSALADQESGTIEETNNMMDVLRDRIQQLEAELRNQEQRFMIEISNSKNERIKHEKCEILHSPKSSSPSTVSSPSCFSQMRSASTSPPPHQPYSNSWNYSTNNNKVDAQEDLKEKSKHLLQLLHQRITNTKLESGTVVQARTKDGSESDNNNPYWIWPQRYGNSKSASLPFIPPVLENSHHVNGTTQLVPSSLQVPNHNDLNKHNQRPLQSLSPDSSSLTNIQQNSNGRKSWCHVEIGWLESIRSRLRQREEECHTLKQALQLKDMERDKIIAEMRYKHETDNAHWEHLLRASQDGFRLQAEQCKERGDQLVRSEAIISNLWMENGNLKAAMSQQEQRVIHLENLLKQNMHFQQPTNNNSLNNPIVVTPAPLPRPQRNSPSPKSLPFYFH